MYKEIALYLCVCCMLKASNMQHHYNNTINIKLPHFLVSIVILKENKVQLEKALKELLWMRCAIVPTVDEWKARVCVAGDNKLDVYVRVSMFRLKDWLSAASVNYCTVLSPCVCIYERCLQNHDIYVLWKKKTKTLQLALCGAHGNKTGKNNIGGRSEKMSKFAKYRAVYRRSMQWHCFPVPFTGIYQ